MQILKIIQHRRQTWLLHKNIGHHKEEAATNAKHKIYI